MIQVRITDSFVIDTVENTDNGWGSKYYGILMVLEK